MGFFLRGIYRALRFVREQDETLSFGRDQELAELMDSLPQEARKKMSIAIGSFEAANVELQAVLDCLS